MRRRAQLVSIARTERAEYPAAPFHPPVHYPEFAHRAADTPLNPSNVVYGTVREALRGLGFDKEHEGTSAWNPLRGVVFPGDRVVLKPNLVFHRHPLGDSGVQGMLTHGSVIRPMIDYTWLALEGKGEIIIGDVPLQTADWKRLMEQTGLEALVQYCTGRGMRVSLLDLRLEHAFLNQFGLVVKRTQHNGDPLGYVPVDLGKESLLFPIINHYRTFTITDYPQQVVSKHHNPKRNEYLIAKTILAADVFINMPKLKTHKKAGVTLGMKNLIGINGDKSWIAHHREGTPDHGGDETSRRDWWDTLRYRVFVALKYNRVGVVLLTFLLFVLNTLVRAAKAFSPKQKNAPLAALRKFRGITEGSWYGNDTLWRVVLDLNRILLYASRDGALKDEPQRRTLTVIDGIVAGERDGPMHEIPKRAGVVLAGVNPLVTDTVAAELMGFDAGRIPQLREGYAAMRYPLAAGVQQQDIFIYECGSEKSIEDWKQQKTFAFLAPSTWAGYVEHNRRKKEDETTVIPALLGDSGGE